MGEKQAIPQGTSTDYGQYNNLQCPEKERNHWCTKNQIWHSLAEENSTSR